MLQCCRKFSGQHLLLLWNGKLLGMEHFCGMSCAVNCSSDLFRDVDWNWADCPLEDSPSCPCHSSPFSLNLSTNGNTFSQFTVYFSVSSVFLINCKLVQQQQQQQHTTEHKLICQFSFISIQVEKSCTNFNDNLKENARQKLIKSRIE